MTLPVATPEAAAEAGAASAAKPRSAERKGEAAAAEEALGADSARMPPLVTATRGKACLAAVAAARAARRRRAALDDMGSVFVSFRTKKGTEKTFSLKAIVERAGSEKKKRNSTSSTSTSSTLSSLSLSCHLSFSLPATRTLREESESAGAEMGFTK